jgi:hypothetical protein
MQNRWEATSVAANDEREDYIAAPPAFLSHTGSPPHARRLFQYRPCAALPLLRRPSSQGYACIHMEEDITTIEDWAAMIQRAMASKEDIQGVNVRLDNLDARVGRIEADVHALRPVYSLAYLRRSPHHRRPRGRCADEAEPARW